MNSEHSAVDSRIPFTLETVDGNPSDAGCRVGFSPKVTPKLLNLFPHGGVSEVLPKTLIHTQAETLHPPVHAVIYSPEQSREGASPALHFQPGRSSFAETGTNSSAMENMYVTETTCPPSLQERRRQVEMRTVGNNAEIEPPVITEGDERAESLRNSLRSFKGKEKVLSVNIFGAPSVNLRIRVTEDQPVTNGVEAITEGHEDSSSGSSSIGSSRNVSPFFCAQSEDGAPAGSSSLTALAAATLSSLNSDQAHEGTINRRSGEPVVHGPVERRYPTRERITRGRPPPVQGSISRRPLARHGPRSRSSRFTGVTHYKRTGRWESHIWNDGKQIYLGASSTEDQAARAYDRAAIHFRQTQAILNFNLGDYFDELKQLLEISSENLVLMLRRQSAGSGAPYPEYPPAQRRLRQLSVTNIEAGRPGPRVPPARVLRRQNTSNRATAQDTATILLGEPRIDASHGQNRPTCIQMQTPRRTLLTRSSSSSSLGEDDGSLCVTDPATSSFSKNISREYNMPAVRLSTKAPIYNEVGAQRFSPTPGWGWNPGTVHVDGSLYQGMNLGAERIHGTPGASTALMSSHPEVDACTVPSPQAAHVSQRTREYVQTISSILHR